MFRAAHRFGNRDAPRRLASVAGGVAAYICVGAHQGQFTTYADSAQSDPRWDITKLKPDTTSAHNVPLSQRFTSGSDKVGGSTRQPRTPPQTKGHSTAQNEENDAGDGDDHASLWSSTTNQIAAVSDSFVGFDFTGVRDKIRDMILPSWVQVLPSFMKKLQSELSMEPWSLGWEIWEEAHDPEINPEILWTAKVRISNDLCREEQVFLRKRRVQTQKALARYLGVSETEVHPDDVPVIAMCGSGGGLRALVAGTSSCLSADEDGLFDCVTYTAGVSGSCWLQALYNSSVGGQSHQRIINHLKQRLNVHIAFPPAVLTLLSQAPTNKFLLSGFVEKLRGVPDADFGLVDVYGLLLAARLLVPKGELRVSDYDLKVSNQRHHTDQGRQPLPIYTAVRHEIPRQEGNDAPKFTDKHEQLTSSDAWFQWFEWTPYEFFCEEFCTGIPTWAVGRRFDNGQSLTRENGLFLPELRVPLMMGIWGSAFCATLSHYYKEIRPIIKACGFGGLDGLMAEKDQDLIKVHPIDPASIPNFALGLRGKLPPTCPESLHHDTHLRLMDAGMSNNLPIYPLLRPGRNVDVIVAFDASADVKTDNWIKVADGYARQRNIRGWPIGAGWPPSGTKEEQTSRELDAAQAATPEQASKKLQDAQSSGQSGEDLGYCTVWVGSTQERRTGEEPPVSPRLQSEEDDWHLTSPDAGLTLIYFPFLKNDKIPGVDPMASEFMSTWNFVYTAEEIDKVVALARANFEEGKEQTRRTIRAVWTRKKKLRLEHEKADKELRKRLRMRRGEGIGRKGSGDHGDHFS